MNPATILIAPEIDPNVVFDAEVGRALDLAISRNCLPAETPAERARERATAGIPGDCISGTGTEAGATPFLSDGDW